MTTFKEAKKEAVHGDNKRREKERCECEEEEGGAEGVVPGIKGSRAGLGLRFEIADT